MGTIGRQPSCAYPEPQYDGLRKECACLVLSRSRRRSSDCSTSTTSRSSCSDKHSTPLHAPTSCPDDGLVYKTIHDTAIQDKRRVRAVSCGPGGVIHDYVAFYFGPLSPMLFQLKSGWVAGYTEGQEPLIYLASTAQRVEAAGYGFAFSDGHGIAAFTEWFDSLACLDKVNWHMVNERYWKESLDEPDRKRHKQAEFLVHEQCPWTVIDEIVVVNDDIKKRVETILSGFSEHLHRPVTVRSQWYYW